MSFPDDEGCSRRRRPSNKEKGASRRTWSAHEEEALVNALKSIVASGWKCDNGFRNGYLSQLEAYLARAVPNCDLKAEPHITSKIQVWERQYSTLVGMMSKSEFGWDESKCMVTVDENDKDVWDTYVKIDPNAKTMRYKSFPHFPAWREIFGKDRANGEGGTDYHREETEIWQPAVDLDEEDNGPTGDWNPDTGFAGLDDDTHPSYNMTVDPTGNESSATKRTGGSSRKRRLEDPLLELPQLVNMVSTFCDSANTRMGKLTRVLEGESVIQNSVLMYWLLYENSQILMKTNNWLLLPVLSTTQNTWSCFSHCLKNQGRNRYVLC